MSEPTVHTETIPAALSGERIDRVVALVADVSRSRAVALIDDGAVLIDGVRPDKASVRVETDATVAITVPEVECALTPEPDVSFEIVYSDADVIVVDKPADLVVHPGSGVQGATLVNGLLARFPELVDVGEEDRPGIVHRLDRGTSGLLMVARTEAAYHSLVGQLAQRSVSRVYRTVVDGLLESESGLIDAPLGRSPRDATRRAVVADGRPARTRYEVVERLTGAERSVLECRLETGRTHQIRAHLAAIDHPVVGDERYGGALVPGLKRPFLHAAHLEFEHPQDGRLVTFDSPLPADLVQALDRLRAEVRDER